jgi:hypothetical protein
MQVFCIVIVGVDLSLKLSRLNKGYQTSALTIISTEVQKLMSKVELPKTPFERDKSKKGILCNSDDLSVPVKIN